MIKSIISREKSVARIVYGVSGVVTAMYLESTDGWMSKATLSHRTPGEMIYLRCTRQIARPAKAGNPAAERFV